MAVKKVLVAVGMVCVLAPAALAMMRPGPGSLADYMPKPFAQTIFQHLYEMIETDGEARVPPRAGPAETRLPFWKLARVVHPELFDLLQLRHEEENEPFGGPSIATSYAASGGPLGQGTTATRQDGRNGDVPAMAGGARGGGSSFAGLSHGAGGGGGGGSDDPDDPNEAIRNLVLDLDGAADPIGAATDPANGGSVSVMPLPASVWMLLASIAGLAFIGYRRRSRTS